MNCIAQPRRRSRRGWIIHLALLSLYPLLAAARGFLAEDAEPALPNSVAHLLLGGAIELAFFALIFAGAWLASRASATDLRLRWRGGLRPVLRGVVYSVALRFGVLLVIVPVVLFLVVLFGHEAAQELAPGVDYLIDRDALSDDPVYFVLMLTLVSFVMAGLREELWRAGMLAGWSALAPERFQGGVGTGLGVVLVAVIFGLAHAGMGWGAVFMTTLLGVGLGAIMVWYNSIWEAVLAHGFFNATTFVFLRWITPEYLEFLQEK